MKSVIIKESVKEVRIDGGELLIAGKERDITKHNKNTLGELGRMEKVQKLSQLIF
ncbi:MAG: hypothetical protein QXJ93_01955 [Candidatus Rehaiarchaeum fermentans]|nr:hypothetical protein [Candidatus Rehaiarchaeum fermentans]